MARRFVGTTANVLTVASAPITAVPLSMSAWVLHTGVTAQGAILNLAQGSGGGTADSFQLIALGSIGSLSAAFATTVAGAASTASVAAPTPSHFTWNHFGGASSGVASRFAYINGKASAEQTTSRTPTAIDSTSIGALKGTGGAFGSPLGETVLVDSYICEVGLWNIALTQAEFLALSKGARVSSIRPGALVGYWLPWDDRTSGQHARSLASRSPLLAATGIVPNVLDRVPPVFRRSRTYFDYQAAAATGGRTTKNTHTNPLGMDIGMNLWGSL